MFKYAQCLFIATFLATLVGNADEPPEKTTHRVLQFENEYVNVWRTVIMPNQPLKMHRHDCARVCVGLKGGTLIRIEETGETSEIPIVTNKAQWLTEDPPGYLHADINQGDEPIEVMIIEVKAAHPSAKQN